MNIQKISVEKLNPAAYNPRKDLKPGDKEYEKLKRSIEEFGYVEPVIWNQKTGNVVGGHQRLKVLLDLGQTEIDCVVVDLDPQREKALNLALNKIQGEWDENKLAELMAELDAGAFDVSLTGFDASEIDELLNRWYSKEAVTTKIRINRNRIPLSQTRSREASVLWRVVNSERIKIPPIPAITKTHNSSLAGFLPSSNRVFLALLNNRKTRLFMACPPGFLQ
jgi:ParB-like chromosome segregation protein Spo0J